MGTPEFAIPSLKALVQSDHHIGLVVTQPDRPKGRGRKIVPPPVKLSAERYGIETLQPESVSDKKFTDRMTRLKPDVMVVVAFGHILSKPLLALPLLGAVNIHASLLPKYRGPAPIQRALINGDKETGVTSIRLDTGLDTGDILLSRKTSIKPDDTSETLHDRLAEMGADILIETLTGFAENRILPIPQDHGKASYAPMLKKEDGRIDWRLPARKIESLIRGTTPWPGAFTFHIGKRLKIFRARVIPSSCEEAPGSVIKGFPDELRIATGKGILSIVEIQSESGKRLPVEIFLRGYPLPPGSLLD
jgi:methionyl-tRNA formyltransferase